MRRMQANDPSHITLIEAVESVDSNTPIDATHNPNTVSALAIKIMARFKNDIPIPAQYKKTAKQQGYRDWQDVMVQLFRRWNY